MTRVLVAGVGPLPQAGLDRVLAPGLRLDTIVRALVADGHEVGIAEALFADTKGAGALAVREGVAYHARIDDGTLHEAIAAFAPNAIFALTDGVARDAALVARDYPMWVDWFGHPMAERQMANAVHDNDASLKDAWLHVLPALLRADRFSGCSNAQRLAIVGELGAAGRLNAKTCGTELVHILRPALPFEKEFVRRPEPLLRGKRVPADARIVLFSGGYNTWLDEETLFQAVDAVLARDPRAVYVSTGGAIDGHVTVVFERFRKLVEGSAHRDRYVFLGWVGHEDFEQCTLEADVGVVCDRPTLEGELGCRNRLFGWIWGGMRAVSASLSENQKTDLEPHGLVRGAPLGNPRELAAAIAEELEAGRPSEAKAAERRATLQRVCSPAACYGPLLEWVRDPVRAPDARDANPLKRAQREFAALNGHRSPEIAELLARMQGSRLVRFWLGRNPRLARLVDQLAKTIR